MRGCVWVGSSRAEGVSNTGHHGGDCMEAIFDKMVGSRCTRLAVVEFDSMGEREAT